MKPETLIKLQESVSSSYRFTRGDLKSLLENKDKKDPMSWEEAGKEALDILTKHPIAALATPPKMIAPTLLGVQSQLGWTPQAAKQYRDHYSGIGSIPAFLAQLTGAAGLGKAGGKVGQLISKIPGTGVIGRVGKTILGPLAAYGGGAFAGTVDTGADLLTRAFLDPRAGSR
jgi:hypothetical protein